MGYINSLKHVIEYENGQAEQMIVEGESGVRIRIYDENKMIVYSEKFDFEFHSRPLEIYFDKAIKDYKLSKLKDDYISIHTINNGHHFYFMVKKANKVSTEITYRMDSGVIYRTIVAPIKYDDIDSIMSMCASIY